MKLSLCNEVIRDMPFAAQCEFAAALGYDALEIAPFTLGSEPHRLPSADRRAVRDALAGAGIACSSLHWLLLAPAGLSITNRDETVRARTIDVMRRLIELAAELEADVLVHGSPKQRDLEAGEEAEGRKRTADAFSAIAADAETAGVTYCIEPLARTETNNINSLEEAQSIVDAIASPALRTMIDCAATAAERTEPLADTIRHWLPTGLVAHVQVNDPNRQGPGQGAVAFAPVIQAIHACGYDRWVAVEPFVYVPDGPASAARAAGYLRGLLE